MTTRTQPALNTPCPACHAHPGKPCTTLRGKPLDHPHPRRTAAWATAAACCPECQVAPGSPCRTAGGRPMPLRAVHHRRYQEAEETHG